MPEYRFYFLNAADHIQGAENFQLDSDKLAQERAEAMRKRRGSHAVEIWEGIRMVYRRGVTHRKPELA